MGMICMEVFACSSCLPTFSLSLALSEGFVTGDCVCTHDPWPENPAGEGAAETEVSPRKKGKGGQLLALKREKHSTNECCGV